MPGVRDSVLVAPSLVSTVKSASPSTLVLQYKEAMSLADDCGTAVDGCRTGITYQQAAAHDSANPSDPWILRDSAGQADPKYLLRPRLSGERRFGVLPAAVGDERGRCY